MPQRTEVEESPIAASQPPAENKSAVVPAPRKQSFFEAKPHMRVVLLVVLIALVIAGIFAWRYFGSYESTDDAQVDGHLMPLSARISGYVTKVNVNDNQFVKAGTVLVEIDPRDYQVAVDQAQAELADAQAAAQALQLNIPITSLSTLSQTSSAEADVASAQANIAQAEQQYDAAQAQYVQAEANDVKAQNDLMRYKQLVDKQEVSQQMYDQALAAAKASTAAVQAAKSSASAAQAQIAQNQSKLASAQANLRSTQTGPRQVASTRARAISADAAVREKQAALEKAQLDLQYTKLTAPVDGVVMKNVELGMNVEPGQQLATIVPLADVWVTANFKETQLKEMRPGQPVEIKVDANGRSYRGHVDSISGSSGARLSLLPPENATGNYVKVVQRIPVKIILDPGQNSDNYLRLGMSVEPKVFIN